MRGSHPGSFDAAHSLRDGTFWDSAGKPEDTGESYDLIIVGGGISGLAAAHFYRKAAGEKARILILDNHDDFGGHAKRNEFRVGNAFRLGFGGTFSIESPAPYSAVAKGVIEELGIDVPSYSKYREQRSLSLAGSASEDFLRQGNLWRRQARRSIRVRAEDTTAKASPEWIAELLKQFLADAPIAEQAKHDLERLYQEKKDYFPGLTSEEKKAKLARMSYASFLTDIARRARRYCQAVSGAAARAVRCGHRCGFGAGCVGTWAAGVRGNEAGSGAGQRNEPRRIPNEEADKYFFHFPDGNASIARLLVRKLIPDAIPGNSSSDVVSGEGELREARSGSSSPVRIRLNSTAVRVKHVGDAASAKEVEVTYARGGKVYTAKAKNAILACWHVVIPYICEELPDKQKEALAEAQKVPLLYTNVAVRNWTSFQKLGANSVYAPGMYHSYVNLDLPVSIGGYECARKPEEPIVVHMMKAACRPGIPARDQHRMGRIELYTTTFETMERKIRDQLARTAWAREVSIPRATLLRSR